jgi:hypothetical protein
LSKAIVTVQDLVCFSIQYERRKACLTGQPAIDRPYIPEHNSLLLPRLITEKRLPRMIAKVDYRNFKQKKLSKGDYKHEASGSI